MEEKEGKEGEEEDEIGQAQMRDQEDQLRGGEMTVDADQDVGEWKMVTKIGKEKEKDHGI